MIERKSTRGSEAEDVASRRRESKTPDFFTFLPFEVFFQPVAVALC